MGKHSSRKKNKDMQSSSQSSQDEYEHNLSLLNEQIRNQMLVFSSDMLAYYANLEGATLLELKHNNDSLEGIDPSLFYQPDVLVIQSVLFSIISKYNFLQVGLIKYNELYERYINGEISYSLQPNIDIIIGNILGLIANFYTYRGALGIYERDIQQPVYGV